MINSKSLFLVIFFSGLLAVSSYETKGPNEKAGKKVDQAIDKMSDKMDRAGNKISKKAKQTVIFLDDTEITAKIKAELLSDPLLKSSQISVTTTDGIIKLSGVVDSQQSINRALEIANSNKYAKSVDNELSVSTEKK